MLSQGGPRCTTSLKDDSALSPVKADAKVWWCQRCRAAASVQASRERRPASQRQDVNAAASLLCSKRVATALARWRKEW